MWQDLEEDLMELFGELQVNDFTALSAQKHLSFRKFKYQAVDKPEGCRYSTPSKILESFRAKFGRLPVDDKEKAIALKVHKATWDSANRPSRKRKVHACIKCGHKSVRELTAIAANPLCPKCTVLLVSGS